MKRYNLVFTFIFCFLFLVVNSENVKVRVFAGEQISSFVFSSAGESYELFADGHIISLPEAPSIFQFDVKGDSIQVKTLEKPVGTYSAVYLIGAGVQNAFKLKILQSEKLPRSYTENLIVKVVNGFFLLVNDVDIENYVAGVVESESGAYSTNEYYKLQSILCRTYTLSHLRRHELEGFNLCDQVHCQAYNGKTNKQNIISAVFAAKGLVVVDSELELITAAYHSNCGGQTVNSENVWSLPTSYLKSVKDTFCLKQPHATWQKKIPLNEWKNYLSTKYTYPVNDSALMMKVLTCEVQSDGRCVFFPDNTCNIPLRNIRDDWKLKSTYFTVTTAGDYVIFNGKGFGHGIGLCQEGAMQMAKKGYSYKDIIHHYYKDVHIVDLSVLDFFKQE